MEEQVGALWHRIITRAADTRYPKAAVKLEEIGKTAGIFFRALGGDAGLDLKSASQTEHGARRTLLQRIAGSGQKTELTWQDDETLHLPAVIDYFPERALNRDLYLWLVALAAADDGTIPSWFARNQRAARKVLDEFPGLNAKYRRLVDATLALRPDPGKLPADEAVQEQAIRAALLDPGSVDALPRAARPAQPVPLWLHPNPPHAAASPSAAAAAQQQEAGGSSQVSGDKRKRKAERAESPESKNPFIMLFRAESIFSWAEYVKVNRDTEEEEDEDNARKAAEDIDVMSVTRDGKRTAKGFRFDLDLPSEELDDTPLGEGILQPEWHYRKHVLLPGHVCVQPMTAARAEPCGLPPHLRNTAKRLRNQFQALTPARIWLKGQDDGAELDLDACLEFSAERVSGAPARERGMYRDCRIRDRDMSCLLLADLSLSTDAWISNDARVIDIIRDSLFLFAEALTATGDGFAMLGFSSLKRNVRLHVLKGFDDKYDAEARGRIAAIKPGYYTRMGAAIRYGATLLSAQRSAQRLLLILTDGKPNDLDQYEGRYGAEDTRMALIEARRQGLQPFCVTIDQEAGDYLPHLFGPAGYVVIHKPADLPKELPLLYAQMTR